MHTKELFLKNAKFAVQPAGRLKVLKEGVKNVHAFVRGDITVNEDIDHIFSDATHKTAVTYNPFEDGHFLASSGLPIFKSDYAWLYNNKRIVAFNERTSNV